MIKKLLGSKYLYYASSIFFGRGVEYLLFFLAAYFLNDASFGEFEFYRRAIEFVSIIIVFGAPTILISFPKSNRSKVNMLIITIILTLFISLLLSPLLLCIDLGFVLIAAFFWGAFGYGNSIIQAHHLTFYDSNVAAKYKVLVSFFVAALSIGVLYFFRDARALIYSCYVALIIVTGYKLKSMFFYKNYLQFRNLKRYFTYYKNLLLGGSFTLVLNTIINTAFMVSDIFIIKYIEQGEVANVKVAQYSFPLTIANILLIVPFSVFQVDIEKIKSDINAFKVTYRKILFYTLIMALLVISIYYASIYLIFSQYSNTACIFIIILIGKIAQALSLPYGGITIIKRMFYQNLWINSFVFLMNIGLSYWLYSYYGILIIAVISTLSLILRYFLLKFLTKNILRK